MSDEVKKEYSFVGKVEIGTDEYRDLIESLAKAQRDIAKRQEDYWNELRKSRDFEEKLEKANSKITSLQEFVESDETLKEKYRNYLVSKTLIDEEED